MRRLAVLIVAALAAMLALAGPAFAHITVSAPGATRGGSDQEITFRVPVEKNVKTVGLTVALPTSTPIASVLVEPLPGWTHTETTTKLTHPIKTDDGELTAAVSQIRWHATAGHGLAPGEYGAFTIIAGQLPDVDSVTFPTLQYYSDGSVVRWNQVAAPGSNAEPDSPAPVLKLASTGPDQLTSGTRALDAAPQRSASNSGPLVLSITALLVAAAALGLAFTSRGAAFTTRARRKA